MLKTLRLNSALRHIPVLIFAVKASAFICVQGLCAPRPGFIPGNRFAAFDPLAKGTGAARLFPVSRGLHSIRGGNGAASSGTQEENNKGKSRPLPRAKRNMASILDDDDDELSMIDVVKFPTDQHDFRARHNVLCMLDAVQRLGRSLHRKMFVYGSILDNYHTLQNIPFE
jgi:hypothetical protein